MEQALVEALALAEREEVELVGVVRDEDDSGRDRLTVDAQAERTRLPRQQRECAEPRQHSPPPPVVLPAVDEPRVDAQGHVVQEQPPVRPADVDPALLPAERLERPERVVPVETEVPREVVPCAERDRHEGDPAFDGDLGHGRERPVAACHPERAVGRRARELGQVLAFLEDVCRHAATLSLVAQLVRARPFVPGARVDDEEAGHAHS